MATSIGTVYPADADPLVIETVVRGLAKEWPKAKRATLDAQLERDLAKLAERLPVDI